MLDPESEQIREVYAYYGLAMYQAQCLERELSILLASQYGAENIDRWIYQERLGENFDSTFGILANKFIEFSKGRDLTLASEIKSAVRARNLLAHHYFWEHAVEFCSTEGRRRMLAELQSLIDRFEILDKQVSDLTRQFGRERGITDRDIEEISTKMLAGLVPVLEPPRLDEPVRIIAAYKWRFNAREPAVFQLLFKTDGGGNILLSDRGLCAGPESVPIEELELMPKFNKALPAEVHPRPKGAKKWNYALSLSAGYELCIRGEYVDGRFVRRYGLRLRFKEKKSE
jgi:hypothetical protein